MTAGGRLVKQLAGETRRRLFGRCFYCGQPSYGHACHAHRDLPQLEHRLFTQSNEAGRTPAREARPASSTKGE